MPNNIYCHSYAETEILQLSRKEIALILFNKV